MQRRLSTTPIHRLAACVLLLALSACGSRGAAPTAEPKGGGGQFDVVLPVEPRSLNPDLASDDGAFTVAQNVYNKLVTLDADYRVIPDLAEAWEVSDDGLTYTFHLAPGVRWHDGQPLTAADVKWTFEAILAGRGVAHNVAVRIAGIETPDAGTAVVRLKSAWAPFLPMVAWYGTFILPRHLYEGGDWADHPANASPVGSGPFRFVEWVRGDHITLAANPDYFRTGPQLDQVVYSFPQNADAGVDLLVSGQADYLLRIPPREQIFRLEEQPGIAVRTFPHPARFYAGFNLRRAPLDDLRVRQAVNMAIDRDEIVGRALAGYGSPGLGFYTPAIAWAYNPEARAPELDRAAAAALLDQAGLAAGTDGVRLRPTLVAPDFSPFSELAAVLAEQLGRVGLAPELVLLPLAEWSPRVLEAHNYDLALADGSHGPDPDNLYFRFGTDGGFQFMGYTSAEFDAATEEGGRAPQPEDRARAYFQAQAILARDLPLAPLAENVQFIISRENVVGLPQVEARGLVTFQDYSLVRFKAP